jgi:hypothetical protein
MQKRNGISIKREGKETVIRKVKKIHILGGENMNKTKVFGTIIWASGLALMTIGINMQIGNK